MLARVLNALRPSSIATAPSTSKHDPRPTFDPYMATHRGMLEAGHPSY